MIGIFLMSMLYEGLKVFREYLLQKSVQMNGIDLNSSSNAASGSNANASAATLGNGMSQALRTPLAGENDSISDGLAVRTYLR